MPPGKIATAFAVVIQLVMAVALWIGAVWLWPDGIGDIPLGSLTLTILAKAMGSIFLVLLGVLGVHKAFTDPHG